MAIRGQKAHRAIPFGRGPVTPATVQPLTKDWRGCLVKQKRAAELHRGKGQDCDASSPHYSSVTMPSGVSSLARIAGAGPAVTRMSM